MNRKKEIIFVNSYKKNRVGILSLLFSLFLLNCENLKTNSNEKNCKTSCQLVAFITVEEYSKATCVRRGTDVTSESIYNSCLASISGRRTFALRFASEYLKDCNERCER